MAKKYGKFEHNPGMMLLITFLVLMIVNIATISVASDVLPKMIVLGTETLDRTWSLIHSMSTLALIGTFTIPFVREWEHRRRKMVSDSCWLGIYLGVNFVGLWIISRFAENLGLGINSWVTVLGLAIALDFVQGMAMMLLEKWRLA